jgi:hypothetical protein
LAQWIGDFTAVDPSLVRKDDEVGLARITRVLGSNAAPFDPVMCATLAESRSRGS